MYARLIEQQIGTNDTATLRLVEELMRAEHQTLDHLTPAEFTGAIAVALAEARDLAAGGELAVYCAALGIATPAC